MKKRVLTKLVSERTKGVNDRYWNWTEWSLTRMMEVL